MDRSLLDLGGAALCISQFTLYGDTRRGLRPSFTEAAEPATAERALRALLRARWRRAACRSRRGVSARGCRSRSRTRARHAAAGGLSRTRSQAALQRPGTALRASALYLAVLDLQETCGCRPHLRVGLRPLFLRHDQHDRGTHDQSTAAHEQAPRPRPTRTSRPRSRRAWRRSEPDVEVLAVERGRAPRRSPTLRSSWTAPAGSTSTLCARVTHHLRDLLRDYTVEVSSPGPERPLTKLDHYRRFLGRRVRVRTREAIEGRKDFKGELSARTTRASRSPADWGTVRIPHERIRRSNLIPQPASSA